MKFTFEGRPAILKNSKIIVCRGKRPMVISSNKYKSWERDFSLYLRQFKTSPITVPINLTCKFYFRNHQHEADLSNLYQGIEDCLQKNEIIKDDKLIYSHDGSCKIFGSDRDYFEIEISLK